MIYGYQQEELRSYCRSCIESLEIWSRRIIHEKMVETYGEGFLDLVLDNGEYLIKKDIRNHVHQLKSSDSTRIKRTVDALFLDDIIYFLCNPKWYSSLFKPALDIVYPQGKDEAREFLTRLIPIRNSLSHSNPISVHDAERAICYTHDFVEGIKQYYRDRGEERMWNVPQIIRITDSRGNIFTDPESSVLGALYTITPEFHLGEEYSISGFVMNPDVTLEPVLFGGTGYDSANQNMPSSLPERFEMGTMNSSGIAGLNAALRWIDQTGIEVIAKKEEENRNRLIDLLGRYDFVQLVGARADRQYVGVVSTLIDGISSDSCGSLFDRLGISVRTGRGSC